MRVWMGLAVLAAGIAAFLYGGTMDVREPVAEPLVYSGIGLVLVALAMLIVTWRRSRARAYTEAAESPDSIARWRIYPTDMAAFRRIDSARAGRLWSLKNHLKFPEPVPQEGFPVVVGETSLLIADKYYEYGLKRFGDAGHVLLQQGHPGFLEISCYITTTKAPLILVLRIPVPAAAREEAERAAAHLESQVTPNHRDRIRQLFGDHFEAAGQETDAPHRMQRRRKVVLPLVALFILALAGFLLYSVVLKPRTVIVPNETFPALPESSAPYPDSSYPPLGNEVAPLPGNEVTPAGEP